MAADSATRAGIRIGLERARAMVRELEDAAHEHYNALREEAERLPDSEKRRSLLVQASSTLSAKLAHTASRLRLDVMIDELR